jgi:hypothetical protein
MCKPAVVLNPPPSGCPGGCSPVVVGGASGDTCDRALGYSVPSVVYFSSLAKAVRKAA